MDSSGYASFADGYQELLIAKKSIGDARYAIAAMLALQLYELIAGMRKEIRVIHRANWTYIKSLYLLCRYYPLLLWFLVMWAYVGDHDADVCSRVVHVVHAGLAPCQFFSQAVMLMRAFAFTGRKRRILAVLMCCYTLLVGVDIWVFCTAIEILPVELYQIMALLGTKGTGCFPNYGSGFMALRIGYSMLAAMLMDLISLGVVVVHCVRTGWNRDVSLARYFVNQGLTAFAAVAIVNTATAISFFRPPRYQTGVGLPLILIIPNIFACRVILQLRAQVTLTDSQIERQHSYIVRNALSSSQDADAWILDSDKDQALP